MEPDGGNHDYGEYLDATERVVVSPAAGVFTPLHPISDRVEIGSTLGFVDCGGESVPVLSPFRGRLGSVVASGGQRLAPHQRVAWLRAS
jgi:[acyl-carrier-protein] S-malonyltransferase